jgi:stage II sporulation protein M
MKKDFLKNNYKACGKFFKSFKIYLWISIGIFFVATLIGLFFPIFFTDKISQIILEMISLIEGKSGVEIVVMIFTNNIKASFFSILLGIGAGIFPIFTGIINGYILGFVAQRAISSEGVLILWQLIPHGVFEIPAILISIAIGMKLGSTLFEKEYRKALKENLIEASRFFTFVIFPLLLIAGIIEGLLIIFV